MFQDSIGFKQLADIYISAKDDSIGLYLGAGVNLPTRGVRKLHFDTFSWMGLLRTIYDRNMVQYRDSFEQLKTKYYDDWPRLAEALARNMSVEKLVDEIDLTFYHCMPREDKYGRLSKRMLDQAPTLHAAICFTARIKNNVENKWTFERNPKIGTVITPNYDFFFGAGWTRYQTFDEHWDVQTPFSRDGPKTTQRPIYYIHGYIPYRLNNRKELVLTRQSYENAYRKNGFARLKVREAVKNENHHLIFIGTSFGDAPVIEILRDAKKQYGARHFAIEKSPNSTRLEEFDEMGIIPIPVDDYVDIAGVLEELYCLGLESSTWERYGLSNKDYWSRLKTGPRGQ